MPSFKYVIELSDSDKDTLLDIVKKGNSPARTILRANILPVYSQWNGKYLPVHRAFGRMAICRCPGKKNISGLGEAN